MISTIVREKIEDYNSLLGCIKYKDEYNFYLMPIAWWILDYAKYDPAGSKEDNPSFRNNIYTLHDYNVDSFLESIREDRITEGDVEDMIEEYRGEFENYEALLFFIDFDNRNYISAFLDIETEEYIPSGWVGIQDDPQKYIPIELRNLWSH